MRGTTTIQAGAAAAVVLALLAATAPVEVVAMAGGTSSVAASSVDDVGSQHSTASELGAGQLRRMSTEGTGVSASVVLDLETNDSFTGNLGDFTAVDLTGAGSWSTTAADEAHAEWSDAGNIALLRGGNTLDGTRTLQTAVLAGASEADANIKPGLMVNYIDGNDYVAVRLASGLDRLGLFVVDDGAVSVYNLDSFTVSQGTYYRLRVEQNGDSITATVKLDGTVIASGSHGIPTEFNASSQYGLYGGGDPVYNPYAEWRWLSAKTSSANPRYISSTHSASNVETAWADLSLKNASATVTWLADTDGDGTFETTAGSTTVSSSTNVTLDVSSVSAEAWRVNVSFSPTDGPTTAELHDEGLLFASQPSSVDNGTASPTNGTLITSEKTTLSIDLSDADFATAQGDTLELTWFVDGSATKTTTVSSNGTATANVSVGGGDHTWHVEVADEYGNTASSNTFEFSRPAELRIFNESAPSKLVDNANVTIRFYFEDDTKTVERTTSDGTINMTGLPVGKPFVVVADADGYLSRRIYVESLLEQQKIYLLPSSATHREIIFDLADFTGNFPADNTVLLVQRSINGTWKTVQGDFFGATGKWTAQLRYNTRHRLILVNTETGARKRLGPFTPLTSSTQVVRVLPDGSIKLVGVGVQIQVSPSTGAAPAKQTGLVGVSVEPQSQPLDYWAVTIKFKAADGSTTTLFSENHTSSPGGGSVNPSLNLTNKAGGHLVIVVEYGIDGESYQSTYHLSISRVFDNQYSLLNSLKAVQGAVPAGSGAFTTALATLLTLVAMTASAATLPISTEGVSIVGVLTLAGFSVVGWVPYSIVFAAGTTAVVMAAHRRGL